MKMNYLQDERRMVRGVWSSIAAFPSGSSSARRDRPHHLPLQPCTAVPSLPRVTGDGPAVVSHSCLSEACNCPLQLQAWRSQGDRTVLVIAHRLHTVQNADQVLVLKQGQLLEQDQLREDQDVYAHLVQQRQEE